MFAVIGAKLSEGLNFADDLARAVVIVGLPFPNLGSPELRERMKYVKMLEEKRLEKSKRESGKDAAAELYENLCMNAVNQSIGMCGPRSAPGRRLLTPSIAFQVGRYGIETTGHLCCC